MTVVVVDILIAISSHQRKGRKKIKKSENAAEKSYDTILDKKDCKERDTRFWFFYSITSSSDNSQNKIRKLKNSERVTAQLSF